MNHQKSLREMVSLGLVLLFLAGCSTPAPSPTPLPPTPTSIPTQTARPTPIPTQTARPTPIPTQTARPTSTQTPIPVGILVQSKEIGEKIYNVSWSPNGQTLAVTSSKGIHLYEAQTLTEQAFETTQGTVLSVAWEPEGTWLVAAGTDSMFIWNMGGRLQPGGVGLFWSAAISPDGAKLAASMGASDGATLTELTIPIPSFQSELPTPGLAINEVWVILVELRPGSMATTPEADGLPLAGKTEQRAVLVWDLLVSGSSPVALRGHEPGVSVKTVAWSPDGTRLASGGDDNAVIIWNVASQEPVYRLSTVPISSIQLFGVASVAWSPNGKLLTSGGSALVLWDAESGAVLRTLLRSETPVVGATWSATTSVAWSPDGTRLASAHQNGQIIVWDVASGEVLGTLMHGGFAWSVAWSPDGRRLASGGWDGTVKLWDMTTGSR